MPEFVEWMQGFPDEWTQGVARTQRLRMLGNAVQVQVGEVASRVAVATLCVSRGAEGSDPRTEA